MDFATALFNTAVTAKVAGNLPSGVSTARLWYTLKHRPQAVAEAEAYVTSVVGVKNPAKLSTAGSQSSTIDWSTLIAEILADLPEILALFGLVPAA